MIQVQALDTGEAPKLSFPCAYPIKIVGDFAPDFKAAMLDILTAQAADYDAQSVRLVDSRNGRYQSLRVTLNAQSEAQIQHLFEALKASGRVRMVL